MCFIEELSQETGEKKGNGFSQGIRHVSFKHDDARALIRSFLAASVTVCAAAKRLLGVEAN
jgi:hypothetical protein